MLSQQQLATMLSLQNKMNTKVNPQWLTAGYGYLRAAMVESVEATGKRFTTVTNGIGGYLALCPFS